MSFELNKQINDIDVVAEVVGLVLKELTEGPPKAIESLTLRHEGVVDYQFSIKTKEDPTAEPKLVANDLYCALVRFFAPILGPAIWNTVLLHSGFRDYMKTRDGNWMEPGNVREVYGVNPNHIGGVTYHGSDKVGALKVLMDFIDPLFAEDVDFSTVSYYYYEGRYSLSYKTVKCPFKDSTGEITKKADEVMQNIFIAWQLDWEDCKVITQRGGGSHPEIQVIIDRSVAKKRWYFPSYPGNHTVVVRDGEDEITHWLDIVRPAVQLGHVYTNSINVYSSADSFPDLTVTYAIGELVCLPLDPAKAERVMGRTYSRFVTQLRKVFDAKQVGRMLDKTNFIPQKYQRITNELLLTGDSSDSPTQGNNMTNSSDSEFKGKPPVKQGDTGASSLYDVEHLSGEQTLVINRIENVRDWMRDYRDRASSGRIPAASMVLEKPQGGSTYYLTYSLMTSEADERSLETKELMAAGFYAKFIEALRIIYSNDQVNNLFSDTDFIPNWMNKYVHDLLTPDRAEIRDFSIISSWQEPKYAFIEGQGMVNRQSGKVMPYDMPIFVFIGNDKRAADQLESYARNFPVGSQHHAAIKAREQQFRQYAAEHPERMKEPDTVFDVHPRRHDQAPVEEVDPQEHRAELVSAMVKVYMKVQQMSTDIMKNSTNLDEVEKVVTAMKNIGLI